MTSTVQIDRAVAALGRLAASGKPGADVLVAQLAGLVAVVAEEAARTGSFRDSLVAALAAPSDGATQLDSLRALAESRPEEARQQLYGLTNPELKSFVREHWPDVQVSKLKRKAQYVDTILERVVVPAARPSEEGALGQHPTAEKPALAEKKPPAKRRRRPSPLNPYQVARESGSDELRRRLASLDIEELKDIVVEYGWNYAPPATGWKTPAKIIDRILRGVESGIERGGAVRPD